ncbi:MAG: DUF6338 family protein [Candidatus Acidiferrales bacterium]
MPSTIGSVLVLVGFVIPGFITLWVWSLAYGRTEPSEGRLVLEGITLSCVNYGAWSWLLVWAWARSWIHSAVPAILLAAFILFVSPMILGVTTVWLSETIWVQRVRRRFGVSSPVPKAWDHYFRKSESCWVVATLKSGKLVAGLYGPNSAASSYPAEEDIYLERLCKLSASGKMEGLIENSRGGIIRMDEVQLIEFYDID